jgi:relaxase-like protein
MPKIRREGGPGTPLLDIGSYARRGPGSRALSPAEVQQIARTVRRTPEVMVKVLRHGGKDQAGLQKHFDYLSRKGELEIETDDGQLFAGRGTERELLADWDLDLEASRPRAKLGVRSGGATPRVAHKLLFSMPARTPPDKVLAAVKSFCREEFGLKHRYAMVLHTDEPHPHVHVVVKAVSEQGVRLNIKKAHLRAWRAEFARHMRTQGVPANATERAVRGVGGLRKTDPIYRAMQRGASSHLSDLRLRASQQTVTDKARQSAQEQRMASTRAAVEQGWLALSRELERGGQRELASDVRSFAGAMAPVRSDQQVLASMPRVGVLATKDDPGGFDGVKPQVPEMD